MELIITTKQELTEIIDGIVERHLSSKAIQPKTNLPELTKRGYTQREVMDLFGLRSPVSINSWERKGLLKPIIVSRKKMYLKEDIETLIQQKQLKKRA